MGLSTIISAGNAIGVKFHEYFEYLGLFSLITLEL